MNRPSHGQSEVFGYIVIFSIVLLSITSIYVSGIASLDSQQATAELSNAEQAMLIFSNNIDDMIQQESPRRSVEIKVADSAIETTARTNITVEVNGTEFTNTSLRGIAYRGEAGDLIYESGALIRSQETGALMREMPLFKFNDDRVLLNIVRLAGQVEFRGSGTSLVVLEHDDGRSTMNYSTLGSDQPVTITIETQPSRAPAWRDYFEEQGLNQVNYAPDAGEVTYRYPETQEVFIRESFVWVRIEE